MGSRQHRAFASGGNLPQFERIRNEIAWATRTPEAAPGPASWTPVPMLPPALWLNPAAGVKWRRSPAA